MSVRAKTAKRNPAPMLSTRALGAALLVWTELAPLPAIASGVVPQTASATVIADSHQAIVSQDPNEPRGEDAETDDAEREGADSGNADSEAPGAASRRADDAGDGREALSITQHEIDAGGETFSYTATAGRLPLKLNEAAQADIFFVAYRRDGDEEAARDRPITFVFNGGPGAASAYLHLGALGPQRLVLDDDGTIPPPPARLAVNHETWLAFTDLVFVDPVGTGYSRRAESSADRRSPFWETRQDIRALAEFIRLYLTLNDCHLSPVFLAGESYGGFRAATLAETLATDVGVGLSGIVLISPVLEFSLMDGDDYTLLPWALLLPAYTATAVAHGRVAVADGAEGAAETLKAVEAFSLTDYLSGLAEGDALQGEARAALYQRIAGYTGLPVDIVERYRGRVPRDVFAKEILASEARVVSLYDGSIAGIDPRPQSARRTVHDPVLQGLTAPLTSAFVAYVRDALGYQSDLRYELLNRNVFQAWQWRRDERGQGYLGAADRLKAAMSLNHRLQTLIAHGYYDLVTSYYASRYVVDQMALDTAIRPNVTLATYHGGHMFYMRAEARRQMADDARAFYRKATLASTDTPTPPRPATRFDRDEAGKKGLPPLAPSPGASVPAAQPG